MLCFRGWLLSGSYQCCLRRLFIACCIGFTPKNANSDFVTHFGNYFGFVNMRKLSFTLFPGEPCTPQIMFNFRSAGSTVWLGAPKHETRILTEAAKNNRRVHISGKWHRGAQSNCSYVEVTSAEVTR